MLDLFLLHKVTCSDRLLRYMMCIHVCIYNPISLPADSHLYLSSSLQVKHKQLHLLQHPLIARYIAYKWWRLSPFFFGYLIIYAVFLVLLTAFVLIVPRPGPDDHHCELYMYTTV